MSDFVYLFRIGETEQRRAMGTPERAQQSMRRWMEWMHELESKGHLKSVVSRSTGAGRSCAVRSAPSPTAPFSKSTG